MKDDLSSSHWRTDERGRTGKSAEVCQEAGAVKRPLPRAAFHATTFDKFKRKRRKELY
jgi:hypothetical protein